MKSDERHINECKKSKLGPVKNHQSDVKSVEVATLAALFSQVWPLEANAVSEGALRPLLVSLENCLGQSRCTRNFVDFLVKRLAFSDHLARGLSVHVLARPRLAGAAAAALTKVVLNLTQRPSR